MVYLTQLVYVVPGGEAAFHEFEDLVLPRMGLYGGELVLRLRPDAAAKIGGTGETPYEVHVVRFETEDGLARFAHDEVRQRALHLKDRSVRQVVVIRGDGSHRV
ncbi:MAG: hypothetical protein JNL83_01185 [Myxococcales bacterium]|nr:hypothetical protein [Myxococcales bacterium]